MVYNRQYNTRNSAGRYNTPGQFVAASPQQNRFQQPQHHQQLPQQQQSQQHQQSQHQFQAPLPLPKQEPQFAQRTIDAANQQQKMNMEESDVDMKHETDSVASEESARPPWMKSKLPGMKKISKKEKRRRQNRHLRRLITPKNALMVLNEMMLHEQLSNFKVEPTEGSNQYYKDPRTSFCADLTLDGVNYKGYGETKMSARNAAAEQAIRDHIIKRMQKALSHESAQEGGEGSSTAEGEEGEGSEETLPMIQLASFALHKLFSEWECEGHKVPHLRAPHASPEEGAEPAPPVVKARPLPAGAAAMHPAMLLTHMRPHLEYRELAVSGDRPQNMQFTMGVDLDGTTYIGKAASKREARRLAAKAACAAVFGVQYDDAPPATA